MCDEDPCAELPTFPYQIDRESSSASPPATSREVVTATGSLPTEEISVRQMTSLLCDGGRYVEKRALCESCWDQEGGLKSYHSEVRKCQPGSSDHTTEKIIEPFVRMSAISFSVLM